MSQSIKSQLGRIMSQQVKMSNGKTVRQNLEGAVRYLYKCLDNQILAYYASYTPSVYERTYNFLDSLYAEDFFKAKVVGNRIEVKVSFRDSMAYHRNIYNDHNSYVPVLINFGWNAPKLAYQIGANVYRFTHYSGFHMVEKAIRQFNAQNPYGVYISHDDVEAMYNGQSISENYFRW